MSEDTIAALATPLGEGGIGVVRMSGPAAADVAARVFRPDGEPFRDSPTHLVRHGWLVDGDQPVDEAMAVLFRAPRSYTGEDVVEISCHGGPFLLKRALGLCHAGGARPAEPGEFTRRAYANGRLDLAQAEAVADLIAAQSDAMRRLALDQLRGRLSGYVSALRGRLVGLLAQVEASLDFAEDEVPDLSREALTKSVEALLDEVRRLLATAPQGRLLRDGLRAVIVGRPNVGKSSLFNALLGADRAIVTDVPGTTRDLLEERAVIDGVPVVLTDTAGLREGAGRVESAGIARARRALDSADAAVLVLDGSRPLADEDRAIAAGLAGRRVVYAVNKSDLGAPRDLDAFLSALPPPAGRALVSAATGRGLDALRAALAAPAAPAAEAAPAPTLFRLRHEELLREAAAALASALDGARGGADEECLTVDLRAALGRLNEITGEGVSDEILHAIFSKFCIGK